MTSTINETSISFKYAPTELLLASQCYDATTKARKFDKPLAILVLLVGCSWILTTRFQWWMIAWFACVPILWFQFFSLRLLQIFLSIKRNPVLLGPYVIRFDETGISILTDTINSRVDWTHFHQFIEAKQLVLLVYGKWLYTVIPKRAFSTASQLETFRGLLNRKIRNIGAVANSTA